MAIQLKWSKQTQKRDQAKKNVSTFIQLQWPNFIWEKKSHFPIPLSRRANREHVKKLAFLADVSANALTITPHSLVVSDFRQVFFTCINIHALKPERPEMDGFERKKTSTNSKLFFWERKYWRRVRVRWEYKFFFTCSPSGIKTNRGYLCSTTQDWKFWEFVNVNKK